MSYTPWVTHDPQSIPPKKWTALWFTDPDQTGEVVQAERQLVLDGHTIFTLQIYADLPAAIPASNAGGKTPGDRPTYIKTRFRRIFTDPLQPDDPTAYDTVAVPLETNSWHHTHTMFLATSPDFVMCADVYHNGKVPLVLGTRILKSYNPTADVRVTIEGRLNPA